MGKTQVLYGQPPLWQKIAVVPLLFGALWTALTRLIIAPIRPSNTPKTTYRYVAAAVIRYMVGTASIAQTQWLLGTSERNYLAYAKKKGFKPESIALSDGTRAFFIGDRNAKKLLVFFHGGAYCNPLLPDWLDYLSGIQKSMIEERGHDFAVLLPAYDLAPAATYPRQLEQATAVMNYLLQVEKRSPSDMIVGGDSAGGNLALALMSHAMHPHPSGIEKLVLPKPFALLLLISPWCSFDISRPSVARNESKDVIPASASTAWSAAFLGGALVDNWNQPSEAEASWWVGNMENVARNTHLYGGSDEILLDAIQELADKKWAGLKVDIVPDDMHNSVIGDASLGYPKSKAAQAIEVSISDSLDGKQF